jgi:hypothetical protein
MFVFDVETLDTNSHAVILSAGIIHIEDNTRPSYDEMVANGLFVKFNSKDQIDRLHRTVSKDTLAWWAKQHKSVRDVSMKPSPDDLSPEDGLAMLMKYVSKYPRTNIVWTRGSLDQMVIDDLATQLDFNPIMEYNCYRDIRTAIDIFTGSTNGYCDVGYPGFDRACVIKHHPVHDCALDGMQLLYGKAV